MLAGRYPSDEFAELRPRIVWDRVEGTLRARPGARMLAVVSGGTIPDRGLYGVFTPEGARVGELDEELVYESRPGETFVLGATTWRIEDITRDRVVVTPAPGRAGEDAVLARRRRGPAGRAGPGHRRVPAGGRRLARRPAGRRVLARPAGASRTCGPTWTRSGRSRAACCPPTARSWSSASATSWATGGCACCRPSAAGSTPRGRWPSRPGSATGWGSRCRPCGATTASSSACPRPTRRRPLDIGARSTPTRSRSWWSASWPTRPCSRPGSGRTRPGRCSCPGAGPGSARRCGRSASGRPTCWRWRRSTASSRSCWRPTASACATSSTCPR